MSVPSVPPPPFDYTNRDYNAIRQQLISMVRSRVPGWTGYNDLNDFGLALIEAVAYAADGLHYYLDRIANEAYVAGAVRPESINNMAALVGYRPRAALSARTTLRFTNTSGVDVTVPAGTLVQTAAVTGANPVFFETVSEVEVPADPLNNTISVEAVEGVTYDGKENTGESLGVSTGLGWQTYTLPHAPVIMDSVRVFMYYSMGWQEEWLPTEDIRAALPGAPVFQVEYFATGPVRIKFGNGSSGQVPPRGAIVKVIYRVGGGTAGNVAAGTVNIISDDVSLAGLLVTNTTAGSGGADSENLESIRRGIAIASQRAPQNAVSLTDFEAIALNNQNVGKTSAQSFDPTIVTVYIGPVDDQTDYPFAVNPAANNYALGGSFITTTLPQVRASLYEAAFAGAVIEVEPIEYVPIYLTVEVTIAETDSSIITEAVLLERLLQVFAYTNAKIGTTITQYDVLSALAGNPSILHAEVAELSTTENSGETSAVVEANQVARVTRETLDITIYTI